MTAKFYGVTCHGKVSGRAECTLLILRTCGAIAKCPWGRDASLADYLALSSISFPDQMAAPVQDQVLHDPPLPLPGLEAQQPAAVFSLQLVVLANEPLPPLPGVDRGRFARRGP
jgi:hypothetical protein